MPKYARDPREMTARFDSTCAESGELIRKGDKIIYYPNGRKAFKVGSAPKAEAEFQKALCLMAEEDYGFPYNY